MVGPATGSLWTDHGIEHYRIDGVEHMEPFLMTVVSDTDLWMFVSSTGALTLGRGDADRAILPYETDDRIHRSAGRSGPVTVIARTVDALSDPEHRELWRPFGAECDPDARRAVAKSTLGNRIVFEEHHRRWDLTFRVEWSSANRFGWVRRCSIIDSSGTDQTLEVLDGLIDVMPAGVGAVLEERRSNLVDAYKRSECGPWGSMAVFTIESAVTDRAEPTESMTATTVWSSGFDHAQLTLDERALGDMVAGRPHVDRHLVTGRAGAYLVRSPIRVPPGGTVEWSMVMDTDRSHGDVERIGIAALDADIDARVRADAADGSSRLSALLAASDAQQVTADPVADAHHLSNVLFNVMRGGTFADATSIDLADVADFVGVRNRAVLAANQDWLDGYGDAVAVDDLRRDALDLDDPDVVRLVLEYLPLTFSRRHGDPSRPWNRFTVPARGADGVPLLTYEGNWRDIFQNWEALLTSFPSFISHVVAKFVNATTIDGYNAYRITRDGIEWEVPDPDDPWGNIGFWGDHQIAYLLRLVELWGRFEPAGLSSWLQRDVFVFADVPYEIAPHDDIVRDMRNTISFDAERAAMIDRRESSVGTDGRLLTSTDGALVRAGLLEKLLVPALGKLANFVPGGGIWMNTQRPEWNDANNTLAGPGLSVVTLAHLRRYLDMVRQVLARADADGVAMTDTVAEWMADIAEVLRDDGADVDADDRSRRAIIAALGGTADRHRARVRAGVPPVSRHVSIDDIGEFCAIALRRIDATLDQMQRGDGLFDAYRLLAFPDDDTATVEQLGLMLEGQVAMLASGTLDTDRVLGAIAALYDSDLYRPDIDSFMLAPNVALPPFVDRNRLEPSAVERVRTAGLSALIDDDDLPHVFVSDPTGTVRFAAGIVNVAALSEALDATSLSAEQRALLVQVFDDVFDHSSSLGRSTTMYGYEGLGSVYWHMVAKLLLAVQEARWDAVDRGESSQVVERLGAAYRRIRAGLGFRMSPDRFGAIPTDCYSHTPAGGGARQPGMTGQVKEEVLARFGEIGLRVVDGQVSFEPGLLPIDEVLPIPGTGSAMVSMFGVPMTITTGAADAVAVRRSDGSRDRQPGRVLSGRAAADLFARSGSIGSIEWVMSDETVERWKSAVRNG